MSGADRTAVQLSWSLGLLAQGRERYQRLTVKYGSGFNRTWTKGPYNSCEFLRPAKRQLPKLYSGGRATTRARH